MHATDRARYICITWPYQLLPTVNPTSRDNVMENVTSAELRILDSPAVQFHFSFDLTRSSRLLELNNPQIILSYRKCYNRREEINWFDLEESIKTLDTSALRFEE